MAALISTGKGCGHADDAAAHRFRLLTQAKSVNRSCADQRKTQQIQKPTGSVLQFGKHHQDECQRYIFGKVGVYSRGPQDAAVAAIAEARPPRRAVLRSHAH